MIPTPGYKGYEVRNYIHPPNLVAPVGSTGSQQVERPACSVSIFTFCPAIIIEIYSHSIIRYVLDSRMDEQPLGHTLEMALGLEKLVETLTLLCISYVTWTSDLSSLRLSFFTVKWEKYRSNTMPITL